MNIGTSPLRASHGEHPTDGVFEELKHIQRTFGHISSEHMKEVAERRGLRVRDVHAVASFYPHFHLRPPAKVNVEVCADMSCHLRGAAQLKSSLQQRFQNAGEREFSLRDVSCLGRCDRAPAVCVNQHYFDGLSAASAAALVENAFQGGEQPAHRLPAEAPRLQSDPYEGERAYRYLRRLVETRDLDGVLEQLKASALRGMGGAGFPTGTKWQAVRNAPGTEKYIVCNADESEPGTIKDRFILQHIPHAVIEGMIIAGVVTGARQGIVYIRHEYGEQEEVVQQEIERAYREGILGGSIFGSNLSFDLSIFVSPGGYICGEETALLEAIEGKRSEPRNKPPFPVFHGLWNQPTVINNVETFAFATLILARGAEWYRAQGVNGAQGLKFVGVSGDVNRPGVFEVPMGTPYRSLIEHHAGGVLGGRRLIGFAPSGPSSGYLPASMADLPLDWDAMTKAGSMVGSGAVVVCGEGACMLDMALNAVKFYRNESCGKCVPCRIGSHKLVQMLEAWTRGQHNESDPVVLLELSHALAKTSICGLGQVVPAPIQSVLKHFAADVEDHLLRRRCPAGVCFQGGAA